LQIRFDITHNILDLNIAARRSCSILPDVADATYRVAVETHHNKRIAAHLDFKANACVSAAIVFHGEINRSSLSSLTSTWYGRPFLDTAHAIVASTARTSHRPKRLMQSSCYLSLRIYARNLPQTTPPLILVSSLISSNTPSRTRSNIKALNGTYFVHM
jgi:hypothetical protein